VVVNLNPWTLGTPRGYIVRNTLTRSYVCIASATFASANSKLRVVAVLACKHATRVNTRKGCELSGNGPQTSSHTASGPLCALGKAALTRRERSAAGSVVSVTAGRTRSHTQPHTVTHSHTATHSHTRARTHAPAAHSSSSRTIRRCLCTRAGKADACSTKTSRKTVPEA